MVAALAELGSDEAAGMLWLFSPTQDSVLFPWAPLSALSSPYKLFEAFLCVHISSNILGAFWVIREPGC